MPQFAKSTFAHCAVAVALLAAPSAFAGVWHGGGGSHGGGFHPAGVHIGAGARIHVGQHGSLRPMGERAVGGHGCAYYASLSYYPSGCL
jgi:hypothetical protein